MADVIVSVMCIAMIAVVAWGFWLEGQRKKGR